MIDAGASRNEGRTIEHSDSVVTTNAAGVELTQYDDIEGIHSRFGQRIQAELNGAYDQLTKPGSRHILSVRPSDRRMYVDGLIQVARGNLGHLIVGNIDIDQKTDHQNSNQMRPCLNEQECMGLINRAHRFYINPKNKNQPFPFRSFDRGRLTPKGVPLENAIAWIAQTYGSVYSSNSPYSDNPISNVRVYDGFRVSPNTQDLSDVEKSLKARLNANKDEMPEELLRALFDPESPYEIQPIYDEAALDSADQASLSNLAWLREDLHPGDLIIVSAMKDYDETTRTAGNRVILRVTSDPNELTLAPNQRTVLSGDVLFFEPKQFDVGAAASKEAKQTKTMHIVAANDPSRLQKWTKTGPRKKDQLYACFDTPFGYADGTKIRRTLQGVDAFVNESKGSKNGKTQDPAGLSGTYLTIHRIGKKDTPTSLQLSETSKDKTAA